MKSYRIYIVGPDRRLQLGEAFQAADDAAAAARAKAHATKRQVVELWEGGRMVGRVSQDGAFTTGGG